MFSRSFFRSSLPPLYSSSSFSRSSDVSSQSQIAAGSLHTPPVRRLPCRYACRHASFLLLLTPAMPVVEPLATFPREKRALYFPA
jgi:hypothetical protein